MIFQRFCKKQQERLRRIERRIEKIEARLRYLNAPIAVWDEINECWVFYPSKKLKKKTGYSIMFGKGEVLIEEKKWGKNEKRNH